MLPAASQMRLAAQSCISFIPNYASYNNISTDGTNIYTSVVVDGSGEMIFNGGNGCGSINYGTIVHWPAALNVISIPGSSTYVGGILSGSQVCPDCYLSETNNQSVAATPGADYNFESDGMVICSLAGEIFGSDQHFGLKISLATYLNTNSPPIGGYYEYKLACPNGTVPTCPASIYTTTQNYKWAEESDVQVNDPPTPKYCLGANIIVLFAGPPAPFNCR